MSQASSDRIKLLIELNGARGMERNTGIKEDRWNNIKRGRARCSTDELDAVAKAFPQFSWWILTGETKPEWGQTSPEEDEIRSNLKMTGTDTR